MEAPVPIAGELGTCGSDGRRLYKEDPEISVDIAIPVLNEAHVLEKSVNTLLTYARASLRYRWQIVIVDNGSTDRTQEVARRIADREPRVRVLHLDQRGRGRALRHAWLQGHADVVCYMDVDLSTGLDHLPALIRAVAQEGYDVATGSRLLRESRTTRSFKRETISRMYNAFLKAVLATRFSDAQCGFKGMSRSAVEAIVPRIEDQSWFFDTEMLVLAEKQGYRIKDIPVQWAEDDDSRVKILRTGWEDVKGIWRLRRQLGSGRLAGAAMVNSGLRRD
jgi:glycosyltransferase involved in cell wall biosynthesis